MASVLIKSIGKQNILSSAKFDYIKDNLNKPLSLSQVSWFKDGKVCDFSIRYERDNLITIFPDKHSNDVEFEVVL